MAARADDEHGIAATVVGPDRSAGRRVAVVLAHPDDETIGCGALLGCLEGFALVIVTDGAPRDLTDAHAYGFETAEAYAAARARELSAALDAGGCRPASVTRLGYADQRAARHLVAISWQLAAAFRRHDTRVVLTHAYEGGHPDHDATAFAVHAAARLAITAGQSVRIVEMPFYRLGPAGMLRQHFSRPGRDMVRIRLNRPARQRKRRMIAAHATQRATLAPFHFVRELFRPTPDYDFAALPNGGRLLYEAYDWGLSGAAWLHLARSALDELRPQWSE